MGIMLMLFTGDIILCCACEAGLWRVRYDSYPDPIRANEGERPQRDR